MLNVVEKHRRAEMQANYVFAVATCSTELAPGMGRQLTEPSFLMLGKEEEAKRLLTYIAMLLDERGFKLDVKEK